MIQLVTVVRKKTIYRCTLLVWVHEEGFVTLDEVGELKEGGGRRVERNRRRRREARTSNRASAKDAAAAELLLLLLGRRHTL